ncbi:MAG: DUF1614 domain-containing protein [bacterium]
MFYLPLPIILFVLLILALPLIIILIQLNIVEIAFANLGLSAGNSFALLIVILIGSLINIPLFRRKAQREYIDYSSLLPMMNARKNSTVIAVNVGGCIIPVLLSLRLLPTVPFERLIVGVLIVSIISYFSSRPVKHTGIAVSFILPLIFTIVTTLLLAPPAARPAFAFIAGTWGIIIGADLMHIKDLDKIGAGVLSIGGAGVFDSIFIIGILAAFLF